MKEQDQIDHLVSCLRDLHPLVCWYQIGSTSCHLAEAAILNLNIGSTANIPIPDICKKCELLDSIRDYYREGKTILNRNKHSRN